MRLRLPHVCVKVIHPSMFLQPHNTEALCSTLVTVAEEKCPTLLPKARAAYIKFAKAFTLFSECHKIYNGREVNDEDIKQLGKYSIQSTCDCTLNHIPLNSCLQKTTSPNSWGSIVRVSPKLRCCRRCTFWKITCFHG